MVEIDMTGNYDILYMFGYNTRQTMALHNALPLIKKQLDGGKDVAIVLIHDAVIGSSAKGTIPDQLHDLMQTKAKVHVMEPDLKARGINGTDLVDGTELTGYDDLIDILVGSEKIISWM
jgi:sulfur relay protein TusB/DsrH